MAVKPNLKKSTIGEDSNFGSAEPKKITPNLTKTNSKISSDDPKTPSV